MLNHKRLYIYVCMYIIYNYIHIDIHDISWPTIVSPRGCAPARWARRSNYLDFFWNRGATKAGINGIEGAHLGLTNQTSMGDLQDPKMEVGTIYKAYCLGLCKWMSPENMGDLATRNGDNISTWFDSRWICLYKGICPRKPQFNLPLQCKKGVGWRWYVPTIMSISFAIIYSLQEWDIHA